MKITESLRKILERNHISEKQLEKMVYGALKEAKKDLQS